MDYEGATSASPALVNNINMTVTDPGSTVYNPWVLDPTPNATTLNLPAVRGVDNLNNMEQVTIDNPAAGTYTVSLNGFSIPQGPQTYYLVYEMVTSDVVLTYPIGGEGFDPAVDEKIRWDAFGNSGTFTLEYSDNNGSTWNTIASGISAAQRYYDWNVPNIVTGEALVRVTRGASSSQSHTMFSIIGVPTGLNVNWHCPDSMEVTWIPVTGATGYEVSLLGAKYMDSVGTAIGTNTLVIYAPSSQDHWWSVKSLGANNCVGRRAYAQFQGAGTFNCTLPVDIELTNAVPGNGSELKSCMSGNDFVSMDVTNNGTSTATNIPVHYQLNGGTVVNEVMLGPLSVGGTSNYTFTTQITPVAGANTLLIWNTMPGDGNSYNDTLSIQFNYSNASAQSLPWSEDFESFSSCGTASDCGATICTMINDFVNEPNGSSDDIDWRTDFGGTPSTGTGPSTDFTPGTSTGKYLYTEASGTCTFQQANLISPCIDLTNASSASLSFAYNMSGANMGELHVDIYMNGSWINDITTPITGDQGTTWKQRSEPLTAYLGNVVNFRFRGITGGGWASDIAIDAISVTGTTGLDAVPAGRSLILFPNPANEQLSMIGLPAQSTVMIYNTLGELVMQHIALGNETQTDLNISDLDSGVYLVQVLSGQEVITKKFIKE